MTEAPQFAVIPGVQVQAVLDGRERETAELVEAAYRLHGEGETVNPRSYFLRFPDRPADRIIALPASLGGGERVDGIKWISSFPENVAAGMPRASAVLMLNDPETGFPFACLEASMISASRTAASAALAADRLRDGARPQRVAFFGAGLIARYLHTFLAATGWTFEAIGVHDISRDSAEGFRGYLERSGYDGPVSVDDDAEQLIRSSDLVVFATTPGRRTSPTRRGSLTTRWCCTSRCATSRRRSSWRRPTSSTTWSTASPPTRRRTWPSSSPATAISSAGTLNDVMTGRVRAAADRPVVFSPFGLGVLDLAVGRHVYDQLARDGDLHVVDDFFHELRRHG